MALLSTGLAHGRLAPAVRCVHYGTTLVLQHSFETTETANLLDSQGITRVSLVPTQLKCLLDGGWRPAETLETVLLGGAPATAELLERAAGANVPVYPTYGMTETASQIATARPETLREYPDTVGQPLQGTTLTILADGEPVGPGESGEIVVDGPTVTPGYLDDAETADAFGDYGFHTGDLGYRDRDGRLWVTGRVDEVINTGGELVSPTEVADVLAEHHSVAAAAVVGVEDDEWGQRVVALVVPADRAEPDSETLRQVCRDQLARHKVPKQLIFEESLPRTASGTIDRAAVRERFSE
ncbi:class I adenylate-forming enzyme family protein [Halovenus salina]|uniref:Class I adenylate-forming enzyme family protein n=1 Tax=Halovenus salina TaxID=1510225 RepID=A0ABD5W0Y4_9EURY